MKAVVASFTQEKALVGAFSVFTNLRMDLFEALIDMFFYNAVLARCVRQLTSGVTIVCYLQLWCKLGDHFTLANIRQESVTTSRTFINIASFITSEFRR